MVTTLARHPVQWTSPQPLWGRFGGAGTAAFRAEDQARPALFRFASDEFMQQVIAMLAEDPRRLGDSLARPETWRNPGGEPPLPVEPVVLPRIVQRIARMRAGAAPMTKLAATTDRLTLPDAGIPRATPVVLPLKLYQPAHQRFYLVGANLVCRIPGFPDHSLSSSGREQVGFVLRRLMRESDAAGAPEHEYAFVKDGRGPHWERVPRDETATDHYARGVDGEERLPLFPLNFSDDTGFPRRLHAGLIPVGRREEYMASRRYESALPQGGVATSAVPMPPVVEPQTRKSARKEQFKVDVSEPWKALIRASYKTAQRIQGDAGDTTAISKKQKSTMEANEGAQLQSWLILLDLADYLALHVPAVWGAVIATPATATLPDTGQQKLFDWLNGAGTAPGSGWRLDPAGSFATSLRDALKRIAALGVREGLESAERTFVSARFGQAPWPNFYFLFGGVRETPVMGGFTYAFAGIQDSLTSATTAEPEADDLEAMPQPSTIEDVAGRVDRLVQLVMGAVSADATTPSPPVPFAAQLRDALKATSGDAGWFVIRCIYTRQDCGPLDPAVVSAPSQRFQLAGFFDPDAPARPIRIALPFDTTPAGMRKHQKNTAFVFSDILCGQVNRLKGLGFVDLVLSVLPWPFHKDLDIGSEGIGPCKSNGVDIGMICSLSIPIITICALILLFMIVLVLDFIFKWIPWFIICFPLPKLKGKGLST